MSSEVTGVYDERRIDTAVTVYDERRIDTAVNHTSLHAQVSRTDRDNSNSSVVKDMQKLILSN